MPKETSHPDCAVCRKRIARQRECVAQWGSVSGCKRCGAPCGRFKQCRACRERQTWNQREYRKRKKVAA